MLRLVVDRPWLVLSGAVLLTAAALLACTRLSLDNSTERFLVRGSEAWRTLERARETFGGDETLFVLLREPDALAPAAVQRLRALTDAIADIPAVERVSSLTTLSWPRDVDGALAVEPLFDAEGLPTSAVAVDQAVAHPLVAANLVSRDRRVASVLAFVSPHPEDPGFKGRLIASVESAIAAVAPGAEVEIGGAPFAQVALNEFTSRDLGRLAPAALGVMVAILFGVYRRGRAVALPLLTIALSLVWTVGLAAALGRSFSVVTSILVPLMLAIGTSYAVRVLSEYDAQRERDDDCGRALLRTLREVGVTVLLCGATTTLGFVALLASPVESVRDLGILASCGSALATIAALTVVPALLAVLPVTDSTAAHAPSRWLAAGLERLHALTVTHGSSLLLVGGLVVGFGVLGLSRITVEQDPYEWFPAGSAVARSTHVIDEEMGGIVPLSVLIEGKDGYDPAVVRAADAVASWARMQPEVRTIASVGDCLRLMDLALSPHGAVEGAGRLPETPSRIAQYLLLYEMGDAETVAPYLRENGRSQVVLRLAHASSAKLRTFVERLDAALPELAPAPLSARITGTGLLRLETNDAFTAGFFEQLLLASLAIAILLAVALRSVRLGVLALVPNLFPILTVYGLLGWLDVPLNAATITAGAAALGNCVDDAVQYLARYRNRRRNGRNDVEARRETLVTVGIPMIASDVVLAGGFSVFLLSSFFPIASLGLLGAAAMILSMLANLFVLPVLVGMMDRVQGIMRRPGRCVAATR